MTKTIEDIEENFNSFIKKVDLQNSEISSTINMNELDEISDEILKAREYLNSFASGEKKSVREKAYNQISNIPFIGNWAKDKINEVQEQHLKDSGVNEVLKNIFESFTKKQKRLLTLTFLIHNMKNNLLEQEVELNNYIILLDEIVNSTSNPVEKMKAIEMSVMAQSQDKIIKEMIYNNINIIIELMEGLHYKISKTLPVIKNTLNNSLNIVGTINSIKDAVQMMNALENLTNEINQKSTESIQSLIIDTTKSLSEGTDIEFYKNSAQRNLNFNKALLEARKKHISKTVEDYNTLKNISIDVSNQIESRVKEEENLIELMIKE